MLIAARDAGVKSFTYAASSSSYGDHAALPKMEDVIGKPLSPYAVTKYVNELYADVFARTYGFKSIGLRYFNVFGPRQDPNGAYAAVIPKWIASLMRGDDVFINGDGETSRDFCFIENVIQANLLAATATDEAALNQVYNVAFGESTSLNQLYENLRRLLLPAHPHLAQATAQHREFRAGDVRHSLADIGKARHLLGYEPQFSMSMGLAITTHDLRTFIAYLPRKRRWQLAGLVVFMLVGAAAELATLGAVLPFVTLLANPAALGKFTFVSGLLTWAGWNSNSGFLAFLTIAFGIIMIVAGGIRIALSWAMLEFGFGVGHDVSVDVYRRTLYQPYKFHTSSNSSDVIASIEKSNYVSNNVILPILQLCVSAVIAIAILGGLLAIDFATAIIAGVGFTVIYLVIVFASRKQLAKNSAIVSFAQNKRVQAVQEGLGGIRDVLIGGTQPIYIERFRSVDANLRKAQASNNMIGSTPRLLIESLGASMIAALACWMSLRQGGLAEALPALGALALGAQKLIPQMQLVYYSWSNIAASHDLLKDVLDALRRPMPDMKAQIGQIEFSKHIRLQNVSFKYQAGMESVLNNIDLTIPKGARIGLIGKTGSGKTTLVDLVMGLLAPSSGEMLIDDVVVTADNCRAWQKHIAHVPQAVYLSDASIAENIAFGEDVAFINPARLIDAARMAQLADFIEGLPKKYQTEITIIMIAHRLSTLRGCERILELSHGDIMRQTGFDEMMQGRVSQEAAAKSKAGLEFERFAAVDGNEAAYESVEVIVVDDGSTDGSLDIIKMFDSSIRWLSVANGGAWFGEPLIISGSMSTDARLENPVIHWRDNLWNQPSGTPINIAMILLNTPPVGSPLYSREKLLEIGGFNTNLTNHEDDDLQHSAYERVSKSDLRKHVGSGLMMLQQRNFGLGLMVVSFFGKI
eukprot:gene16822-17004_t